MGDKVISIVDADPELGELLDEHEYERARREALARVSRLSPGVLGRGGGARARRPPPRLPDRRRADGARGRRAGPALLRAARPRRRAAAVVVGRRGLARPGRGRLDRARGDDARRARPRARRSGSCRGPTLGVELFNRGTRRAHHLAVALAISHHQRVDDRLLLTLWHLAERWGRVTPTGIVVPLPLGHQRLADLVGAHRPSVTTRARRAHPRRVDLAPRRRQLAAARRAAGAAAPPQAARPRSLRRRQTCARRAGGERRGRGGLEAPRIEPDHARVRIARARRARSWRGRGRAAAAPRGSTPRRARGRPGRSTHAARHSATATSCAGSQ